MIEKDKIGRSWNNEQARPCNVRKEYTFEKVCIKYKINNKREFRYITTIINYMNK